MMLVGISEPQVVVVPVKVQTDVDSSLRGTPDVTPDRNEYRIAFSYDCAVPGSSHFSGIAVADFDPSTWGRKTTLHVLDTATKEEKKMQRLSDSSVSSASCPRFVPSSEGTRLLFVRGNSREASMPILTELVVMNIPDDNGASVFPHQNKPQVLGITGEVLLPQAPIHGCPEFVPKMSNNGVPSLGDILGEQRLNDTFVYTTDTDKSRAVMAVSAQLLAVTLQVGWPVDVKSVNLLYNIDELKDRNGKQHLRVDTCQPIHTASREGDEAMQTTVGELQKAMHLPQQKLQIWLSCFTADGKVAVIESLDRDNWVNMTVPYPSGNSWCTKRASCFDVWSNPNPHAAPLWTASNQ